MISACIACRRHPARGPLMEIRFVPGHLLSVVRESFAFGVVVDGRCIACLLPVAVLRRHLGAAPTPDQATGAEVFERNRPVIEATVRRLIEESGIPSSGELVLYRLAGRPRDLLTSGQADE